MEFEMRKVCILMRSSLQHNAFYSLPRDPRGFWKCAFLVSGYGHLQLIFVSFKTFFLPGGPETSREAWEVVLPSVHNDVEADICMAEFRRGSEKQVEGVYL